MIVVNVDHKAALKGLQKHANALDKMRRGEANRALQSVLNRGITIIRKKALKDSATKLDVTQKSIKGRFAKPKRARPGDLSVSQTAYSKALNAYNIGAKTTDSGLVKGPYTWEQAFVVTSPFSNRPVALQRVGKKRYPTKSAGLGKAFVRRSIKTSLESAADYYVRRQFIRELELEYDKRFKKLIM